MRKDGDKEPKSKESAAGSKTTSPTSKRKKSNGREGSEEKEPEEPKIPTKKRKADSNSSSPTSKKKSKEGEGSLDKEVEPPAGPVLSPKTYQRAVRKIIEGVQKKRRVKISFGGALLAHGRAEAVFDPEAPPGRLVFERMRHDAIIFPFQTRNLRLST
jgi:hypothetical protein